MHLHRTLAVVLALGTALAPAAVAGEEKKAKKKDSTVWQPDESGCRDVVGGAGEWDHLGTTPLGTVDAVRGGDFTFSVTLAQQWSGVVGEQPCDDVTYTFVVFDSTGVVAARHVVAGAGRGEGQSGPVTVTIADDLEDVNTACIAVDVTTSDGPAESGFVHDHAPDQGARERYEDLCTDPGTGSPGQTWN